MLKVNPSNDDQKFCDDVLGTVQEEDKILAIVNNLILHNGVFHRKFFGLVSLWPLVKNNQKKFLRSPVG